MPVETDTTRQKKIRKRLILIYLALSMLAGLIFLLIHSVRGVQPLPVAQSYTAFIIPVTLLLYIPFYLLWARKADMNATSAVLTPILFLCGVGLTPVALIDVYNHMNDAVVKVESVSELRTAQSNFLAIQNLTIHPVNSLYHTYHKDNKETDNHNVTYYGLIPITTNRTDSLYDTWIVLEYYKSFSMELPDSVLEKEEKAFYVDSWNRMQSFRTDSVNFYDNSKLDNRLTLRKTSYPLIDSSLVLVPVYESFEDWVGNNYYTYIIMASVLALIFWFITAVKEDS